MGRTVAVRVPAGARDISILHSAQKDCGVHPAFYPMSTKGIFHGVNLPGNEAVCLPPPSEKIRNDGDILAHTYSWRSA